MRIAITGANSSVGTALLSHLVAQDDLDVEARAGVRRQAAVETLPVGPRITPCVVGYDDEDTLAALLDGADCVVHLAGILIESEHTTYQTANVDATRAVVEAARRAHATHLVFISSLGADVTSENAYYRSKGEAEQLVVTSGISCSIIRTPILLGPGTAGGDSLVGMASRESVRVLGGGHHSLRPLDVDDLCDAILHCCRVRPEGANVHDLVGPEAVTQRDLIATVARLMGREVSVRAIPVWMARLGATVAGWVRRGGMTATVIDVITADEAVHANADVGLDVTLTPLSQTLEKLLPKGP